MENKCGTQTMSNQPTAPSSPSKVKQISKKNLLQMLLPLCDSMRIAYARKDLYRMSVADLRQLFTPQLFLPVVLSTFCWKPDSLAQPDQYIQMIIIKRRRLEPSNHSRIILRDFCPTSFAMYKSTDKHTAGMWIPFAMLVGNLFEKILPVTTPGSIQPTFSNNDVQMAENAKKTDLVKLDSKASDEQNHLVSTLTCNWLECLVQTLTPDPLTTWYWKDTLANHFRTFEQLQTSACLSGLEGWWKEHAELHEFVLNHEFHNGSFFPIPELPCLQQQDLTVWNPDPHRFILQPLSSQHVNKWLYLHDAIQCVFLLNSEHEPRGFVSVDFDLALPWESQCIC